MKNQTTNTDVNSNFISFYQYNNIEIPLIQRDYVQGSNLQAEKRDAFIDSLYTALTDETAPCDLDFIYGTFENEAFFPLDGQQRLTTLYLLHWYLLNKCRIEDAENYDNITKEINFDEKQFSYKTRRSSTAFCQKLIVFHPESFSETISEKIKEQNWFSEDWQQDPSVIAMLDMLDALNNKFKKLIDPSVTKMLERLLNTKAINFDKLDMGHYRLTDSLYIKMNARGKQLTDFENWKANFIQFLEENYNNQIYIYAEKNRKDNFAKIKDYFTHSIEHEWTDLFWSYTVADYKNQDNKTESTLLIDPYFLNFYYCLCRVFSSLEEKDSKEEEDKSTNITEPSRKLLFKEVKNVEFLFGTLDLFVQISQNNKDVKAFFKSLFYLQGEKTDGSVKLFSCENEDLFELCIKGKATVDQQILLFCIIKYCIKHKCYTVTNELKKYTRVCRNLLETICQRLTKDMKMHSNVRFSELSKYIKTIDNLCSVVDISELNSFDVGMGDVSSVYAWMNYYPNTDVYLLEESDYTHGSLYAFDLSLSLSDIQEAFKAFEESTDLVRVKLLVVFGYEGADFGWCAHGIRKFFGYNDRWDVLFRYKDDIASLKEAFTSYIKAYQIEKDLNKIITNKLQELQGKDYLIYYFLKYDAFTNSCLRWAMNEKEVKDAKDLDAHHFFSIKSPYNIITLPRFNSRPLLGYHTDPYACAVAQELRKNHPNIYKYMDYTGRDVFKAPITFSNYNIELRCEDAGWLISFEGENKITIDKLKKLIPLLHRPLKGDKRKKYILQPDSKDRIETAIEFIEQLFL